MSLPVRYQGAVVLAIPAMFLVATLAAWIWSRQSALEVQQQIDHTETVLSESELLLRTLLDAETGVRGYDITREEAFLEPYRQAMQEFPAVQERLEQLLGPYPHQRAYFQTLDQLAQQQMALMEQRVALIDTGLALDSPRLIQLGYRGKALMDTLRQQIAAGKQGQREQLDQFRQRAARLQQTTILLLWFTVSIGLVGYSTAIYLFSQLDWQLQERDVLLTQSKTLIQEIMFGVVDGVITVSKQGTIDNFNPAAARMFGYQPQEVVGQDLSVLLLDPSYSTETPPRHADDPRVWDKPTFQIGGSWEDTGYRKDGTAFPVEISISDMAVGDQMLAIVRDISDRKQAEEKLKTHAAELARLNLLLARANTDLETRNQDLDQFVYVASHDLKAPLRAITNLSEWMEEDLQGQLPEESLHHMTLLRQRVRRMEALINGLLEYSRVGRTQVRVETVSVQALLHDIVDSLAPPPGFVVDIGSTLPTLKTRKILLSQVFANLISNAIKHHPGPTGRVTITAEDQGNYYRFTVADDGSGIDPKFHARVFTIFQTLEARDKVENTGIGLSIVKKIVETEGGRIQLDSAPGAGAAFHFTWCKQSMQHPTP